MKRANAGRLADLILVRLSVRTKRPPALCDVSNSLHTMLARQLTASEWKAAFEGALERLRKEGLVEPARLVSTPAGQQRARAALRLSAPPRAKNWRELKSKYLPRLFFESTLPDGAKLDPSLAVLAERLGVPLEAKATRARVIDAWLARTLGLSPGNVSPGRIRAALLGRELEASRRDSVEQVVRVAVATLSGAPSATNDAVTDALTARWLLDEATAVPVAAPSAVVAPVVAAPVVAGGGNTAAAARDTTERSLQRVVDKVRQASEGSGVRHYGPNKVFIASVWEALAGDAEIAALGERGFKQLLAEAHRRGLLVLSRADLVAAMDPRDVAASEIRHQSATYHFIQRGASA